MRILHVIDSGGLYGAEKVLLALAEAHRFIGLDVEIACMAEANMPTTPLELEADKLRLKWQRFSIAPGPDLRGITAICKYAGATRTSILHSHGYKANILLALLPNFIQPLPVLTTLHGWTSINRWERTRFYEFLERMLLKRIDRVVAVSDAMVNAFSLDRRLGHRLTVIHNGIGCRPVKTPHSSRDLAQTRSEIRKFIGSRIPFVFAGRISPEKDLQNCIRAFHIAMEDTRSDLCLIVFGDGPERQSAEHLVRKLDMTDRILIWGYCEYLSSVLDLFRAMVISSITEGMPIVALEAMRAALPVIATRVGGLPELVDDGNTGYLVPRAEPQILSDAITKLADGKQLASDMGIEGCRKQHSEFNIAEVANRYLGLYEEIVQHPTYD